MFHEGVRQWWAPSKRSLARFNLGLPCDPWGISSRTIKGWPSIFVEKRTLYKYTHACVHYYTRSRVGPEAQQWDGWMDGTMDESYEQGHPHSSSSGSCFNNLMDNLIIWRPRLGVDPSSWCMRKPRTLGSVCPLVSMRPIASIIASNFGGWPTSLGGGNRSIMCDLWY